MDGETVNLANQDQTLSNQPPPQQSVEPAKKINLLGIIFIIIILILFSLGFLNYLNILLLSTLFPNQLGWLPRKEVPTGTSQQSQQYSTAIITPTVSLTQQAEETLISFLPVILNPSLLPKSSSDVNLREDKGIKQSVSGTWDTKDGKAITILTVSPNGKEISQLLIFFPYVTTESVSTEFAQSIIPKLFSITPKGKWACKTIPDTANYCENFWEEANGTRRGIALKRNIPFSQAKKITISFCERSQKSSLYSWKSCAVEFAETGVQ